MRATVRLPPRIWGKPWQHGLPKEELGKPPDESSGLEKQVLGRRRFAPAQPGDDTAALSDVATKTRLTHAPWRARPFAGKVQLPPAREGPCTRSWDAPNDRPDSRGVPGLANGSRDRAAVR